MDRHFFTVLDAAKFLGTTPRYIRKLCFEKQIPHYKPRGRLLFDQQELEAFVRAGKVPTNDELKEKAQSLLANRGLA